MKNIKKRLILLFVKLFLGATIFLLLEWFFKDPNEQLITTRLCFGFAGYSLLIITETVWNIYQNNKIQHH